ncbi:MAG: 16S rRNA (cytosine(967)-C(5))-methyltransferase RsmB [Desulfobulbaceae bacterium]|nr:MAG: 16S rRNA (cytosine(967)-C(5))-methyltransferase RsmB [Desulfobulbaceae bacterium]
MKPNKPPKSARHAAIEVLYQLDRTTLPLTQLFEKVVGNATLNSPDKHLCMKICYGVLRNRQFIEYVLNDLCKKPLTKMMPFSYHALCCGVFQLLFLDRMPPPAAINETVQAAVSEGLPRQVTGFINGVLRECDRRHDAYLTKLENMGKHGFTNHPSWLTERWTHHFGHEQMTRICQINNQEPTLQLRCCGTASSSQIISLISQEGIVAIPGNYSDEAVILPDYRGSVANLPGYSNGLFMVQDQAAQLATLLLAPFEENQRILDCCAGSGGKTIHLTRLSLSQKSQISALEPAPHRYRQLSENLQRTGTTNQVKTYLETIERFGRSAKVLFDSVLVDAPCSGTGVIRRNPDIRWYRQLDSLYTYQKKQLTLLDQAASLLAPEGVLVYATCSLEPEENDQVVTMFLEKNRNFSLSDCTPCLPEPAHAFVTDGCFNPLPQEDIDGFFAARLQRNN